MIFQELSDAPALTVAENISMGRLAQPRGAGALAGDARARAQRALDELGVDLDPMPASAISASASGRSSRSRARSSDRARCLILDEPTAALSASEAERLFGSCRRLRDQGTALIYITHRLDEVIRIADRVAGPARRRPRCSQRRCAEH